MTDKVNTKTKNTVSKTTKSVKSATEPTRVKRKASKVTKASNEDMNVARLRLGEIGSTQIEVMKTIIESQAPIDLQFPNSLETYNRMAKYDSAVSSVLDANYLFVEKAFCEWEVKTKTSTQKAKDASDFIRWCLNNMDNQTLRQVVRSASTYQKHGFSILEKVYTKVTSGTYQGKFKISKLAMRPQETLHRSKPFTFSNDGRELLYINQDLKTLSTISGHFLISAMGKTETVSIPRSKVLLFGHNTTDANPLGESPLNGCYRAYMEKELISDYEVVGVTRDLGGIPLLKIPSDILNIAAQDPTSPEKQSVDKMVADLANLHSGEQAMLVLPSDVQDSGNTPQYSIEFKGVEGSGKMFDTQELIRQRNKDIYDRFCATFLMMGEGGGSYAMSDNKQTLHSQYIERIVDHILEVLNSDLIPQLLALNGIFLPDEEMPYIDSGEMGDPDIEAYSKMVQRVVATGSLPLTPEVVDEILQGLGFKYRLPFEVFVDDKAWEDFKNRYFPEKTTRAGEGMAKGTGYGTSDSVSSLDTSTMNSENAS